MRPSLVKLLLVLAGLCVLPTLLFAGSTSPPDRSGAVAAPEAKVPLVTEALGPVEIETGPPCGLVKVTCAAADYDGSTAVGPGDMSIWLTAFFAGPPYNPIYDLNADGTVTPADFSILLCLFFNC